MLKDMNRVEVLRRIDETIQELQRSKDLIEFGIKPSNDKWNINLDECREFLEDECSGLIDINSLKAREFPGYIRDLNKEKPSENSVVLEGLGVWINQMDAALNFEKIVVQFREGGVEKENELDLYKKVGIDEECLDLCYALNHLPGVITLESCCGHCKDLYRIWFRCTNTVTLALLYRSVCRRYSTGRFTIKTYSGDVNPRNEFLLESTKTFKCPDEMKKEVEILLENIQHWTNGEFKKYFANVEEDQHHE